MTNKRKNKTPADMLNDLDLPETETDEGAPPEAEMPPVEAPPEPPVEAPPEPKPKAPSTPATVNGQVASPSEAKRLHDILSRAQP